MEFECPRCSECINDEELIEGKCPICGWYSEMNPKKELKLSYDALTLFYEFVNRVQESIYYPTEEYPDYNDRNVSILTVRDADDGEMQCNFKLIPTFVDTIKPKKCSSCGRLHFKIGGKLLKVEVTGSVGRHRIVYFCEGCCD
jgi:hypothetical protein